MVVKNPFAMIKQPASRGGIAAAGAVLLVIVWAIWANFPPQSTKEDATHPPILGDMQNFTLSSQTSPVPQTTFRDGNGNTLGLADFAGKILVVNFWATWCFPCIREIPTLDRLQGQLGGEDFEVIAMSQDREGADVVRAFFTRTKVKNLKIYVDAKGKFAAAFAVRGLPTTLVLDRGGRELGRISGIAEWDGRDARDLIEFFMRKGR